MWPERLLLKHGDLCCTNRDFNDRVNLMAHVLMVNCSALPEFFSCAKTASFIVPVKHHPTLPELVRLAVPRRAFTIGPIEYVVERIAWPHRHRDL